MLTALAITRPKMKRELSACTVIAALAHATLRYPGDAPAVPVGSSDSQARSGHARPAG